MGRERLVAEIENFKSIGRLELELGDVNVFFGPVASGKSNVLDALAFAGFFHRLKVYREEYEGRCCIEPLYNLARFCEPHQLFRRYDASRAVRVRLESEGAVLECYVAYVGGAPKVTVNGEGVPLRESIFDVDEERAEEFRAEIPFESRLYSFDRYGRAADPFSVAPLFKKDGPANVLSDFGWNPHVVVKKHARAVEKVNRALRDLGLGLEVVVDGEGGFKLLDHGRAIEEEVGEGVPRLLYYLLALESLRSYAKIHGLKGALALLEEPESHLYPRFLDVLADEVVEASRDVVVCLTTYSPLLLERLYEGARGSGVGLRAYYVHRSSEGSTAARELDLRRAFEELVLFEELMFGPPSFALTYAKA